MKISILIPDSKRPNHAAMKISAYHKARGDEVMLGFPLMPADKTYASIIFDWTQKPIADIYGGPGISPQIRLPEEIEACRVDYDLYPEMDYSLGYTYRACHRGCDFCKVPEMGEPTDHRSIWSFHEPKFKKISLLNNNTFEDPKWRETFEEIWDAKLKVIDQGGYDARLMTEERAEALAKTKWASLIHTAWDRMEDGEAVLEGIKMLIRAGVRPIIISCYVLVGFNTTEEQDIYRMRQLRRLGVLPFAMPYNKPKLLREKPYAKKFFRKATRPPIIKEIDWEKVFNWLDVVNY